MTLEQIIDHLKTDPQISQNITHWQVIPSHDAMMVDFPHEIDERLKNALQQKGNACIAILFLIQFIKR